MATSRIADSVGRVLGDRYRLTRPLGVGASAHVYVAEDVRLRRRVAVKVLHPGLAGDEGFLRRFRAEAQAVASLRHPNILIVFDWGEDTGSPYLVTELLEGGSLRSMLDKGVLLSPAQAAGVGGDAARALDYAHRRGIVHRDIKPANLIFDDEGRVRVADFGLARALAEATWTEPEGAVVGTARYAAPEQARGERLDSRADVYSLALVLVEATTGSVPFASDTTLGTLMARIERPLEAPPGTGALAPVLDAAGTVDPRSRLDAGAFARRLDGVAAALPVPARLPLADPISAGEVEQDPWAPTEYPGRPRLFDVDRNDDPDGDDLFAAADDAELDVDDLGSDSAELLALEAEVYGLQGAGQKADGPVSDPRGNLTAKGPDQAAKRKDRSRPRGWKVAALLVLLLLALGGTGLGYSVSQGTFSTPTRPVPEVVGLTGPSAQATLQSQHLQMAVSSSSYSPHVPRSSVISQNPAGGGRLKEGSTVQVVLSLGPQPIDVPSLASQSAVAAAQVVKDLGLVVGQRTFAYSMTITAGYVISSSPDHGTLLPGQAISLLISKGKPVVVIPGFSAGSTYAEYSAALTQAGLIPTETLSYSNTVPQGSVVYTSPSPGSSVVIGTTVTVEVSKGPHLVAVPVVAQSSVGTATQALSADGFQITEVLGNPTDTVIGTRPAGGTLALYGSPIVLVTG